MQDRVKVRATYADLEAVPPQLVAELVYGQLITHPRPTGRHAEVHFMLGAMLAGPFRERLGGPGGWRFLTEPELHLGADVTVPELAGWRVERIPPPPAPDALEPVKIRLRPDWVCEILSPSTERYDRGDKREIYAAAGVRHLWLVDPRIELLEIFALDGSRWTLVGAHTGDVSIRAEPFDAVELALSRLWPRRPEPARASEERQ